MIKEYGERSRTEIMSAAEWAAEDIAERVHNYILSHEQAPSIGIKGERYSLEYCASILRRELSLKNIGSHVDVLYNGEERDLVFNLDDIADKYFKDMHV